MSLVYWHPHSLGQPSPPSLLRFLTPANPPSLSAAQLALSWPWNKDNAQGHRHHMGSSASVCFRVLCRAVCSHTWMWSCAQTILYGALDHITSQTKEGIILVAILSFSALPFSPVYWVILGSIETCWYFSTPPFRNKTFSWSTLPASCGLLPSLCSNSPWKNCLPLLTHSDSSPPVVSSTSSKQTLVSTTSLNLHWTLTSALLNRMTKYQFPSCFANSLWHTCPSP